MNAVPGTTGAGNADPGVAGPPGPGLLPAVLPGGAVGVERFDDPPGATLFPAEAALVATAVPKRRREFTTVRYCARQALTRLGLPPVPLLPGELGAPQWPEGVVGSMTHCPGYRAAAVAGATRLHALGIDAEPDEPLPAEVSGLVLRPEEAAMTDELRRTGPAVHWDRLVFSVKESVYKAWFPLARRWLDFDQASVMVWPDGRFTARLLVSGPVVAGRPVTGFTGRWRADRGLLVTGAWLAVGDPPA